MTTNPLRDQKLEAAENARLEKSRFDLVTERNELHVRAEEAETELTRLNERVRVLTEALEAVMADRPSEKHNGNRNDLIAWQMWHAARAALADESKW